MKRAPTWSEVPRARQQRVLSDIKSFVLDFYPIDDDERQYIADYRAAYDLLRAAARKKVRRG